MKKLFIFTVFAFAAVGAFGTAHIASAKDDSSMPLKVRSEIEVKKSDDLKRQEEAKYAKYPLTIPGQAGIDAKVKAELEATLKSQNEKCAGLSENAKRECLDKNEMTFQMGMRKAINLSQSQIDAQKIINIRMMDGRTMVDGKIVDGRSGDGKSGPGETKDIKDGKTDDSKDGEDSKKDENEKKLKALTGEDKPWKSNFQAIYANYFKRVSVNLEAIYERIYTLSTRVESRIIKAGNEGVDVTESKKLFTQSRDELNLAKISIDAAQKAFESESGKTIPGSSVVNDKGVTITTGEEEFNKCVANGGKIADYDKSRCWSDDKHVFANPSAQELVGLMAMQIRNEKTSFPETLKNIKEAKTHLKAAHALLAKSIANLKIGLGDDVKGDDKKIETGKVESVNQSNIEVKTN